MRLLDRFLLLSLDDFRSFLQAVIAAVGERIDCSSQIAIFVVIISGELLFRITRF